MKEAKIKQSFSSNLINNTQELFPLLCIKEFPDDAQHKNSAIFVTTTFQVIIILILMSLLMEYKEISFNCCYVSSLAVKFIKRNKKI